MTCLFFKFGLNIVIGEISPGLLIFNFYRCGECEKGFPTEQSLRQHKFTHGGLRPYKEDTFLFFNSSLMQMQTIHTSTITNSKKVDNLYFNFM